MTNFQFLSVVCIDLFLYCGTSVNTPYTGWLLFFLIIFLNHETLKHHLYFKENKNTLNVDYNIYS